jgi:RNA polymerase sigma factor (sigma-70 family)
MSNEREVLDSLVSEHLASMMRLAIRLTGSVESAEDIVQEALLRVIQGWGTFRHQSSFKTWAFRIALNVFSDWISKDRKSPPITDVPDARQLDPPSCAMAEELGRYIAARVSALPPRQREVLILVTYEGFLPEEAAELLDMQVANIYSTYAARQRLRVELASFLPEKRNGK